MTDLELLSRRLQALENRFRTLKLLVIIAAIVVAARLLMGQAPSPFPRNTPAFRAEDQLPERAQAHQTVEDEVRARQIILADAKGNERASLVTDNTGSVFLVMADKNGKARVNLSINNNGPALTFFDSSGQARTILESTSTVPSHVNDNGIAELAPASSIVFFDSKGMLSRTP
jgi:hypothetical protein